MHPIPIHLIQWQISNFH